MSELKDRLRNDLTASMKARDSLRSSTLRMVLTSITNAEVSGKEQRRLTDEDLAALEASLPALERLLAALEEPA